MFGSDDSIGSEPRFDYHHQILREEDQNRAAVPHFNMSFNAITDFDLMGVGCVQYKYVCIEFAKGENPEPDFYLPLNGNDKSIISCQRAKCLSKFRFRYPIWVVEQGNYHVIVVTECSGVQHPMISMLFIP